MYIKDKKKETRFKNALETRENLEKLVNATQETLKEIRNYHFDKVLVDRYDKKTTQLEELQTIVEGKAQNSYFISDRVGLLEEKVNKLNTNKMNHDQIDSLAYAIYTLKKNTYLQKKSGKKAEKLILKLEKKLKKAKEYQTISNKILQRQQTKTIDGHIKIENQNVSKVIPLKKEIITYKEFAEQEQERKKKTKNHILKAAAVAVIATSIYLGIHIFTPKNNDTQTIQKNNETQLVMRKNNITQNN
jgi:hypothetical protein